MASRSAQKIRHRELFGSIPQRLGRYTTVTTVEPMFDDLSNFDSRRYGTSGNSRWCGNLVDGGLKAHGAPCESYHLATGESLPQQTRAARASQAVATVQAKPSRPRPAVAAANRPFAAADRGGGAPTRPRFAAAARGATGNVRLVSTESESVITSSTCATGSRARPAPVTGINSQPATTSKARDQPWVSRPLRSSAARIWLSHSVPSWRPFGSWSPRSQRQVVIIASTRIRHSPSKP